MKILLLYYITSFNRPKIEKVSHKVKENENHSEKNIKSHTE